MYVFVYVIIIDMSTIAQAPNKTWKTFSFILLFSVSLRLHFPPSILLPSFFFIYCLITPHRRKKKQMRNGVLLPIWDRNIIILCSIWHKFFVHSRAICSLFFQDATWIHENNDIDNSMKKPSRPWGIQWYQH